MANEGTPETANAQTPTVESPGAGERLAMEFDVLRAALDDPAPSTPSDNPRDTLTDEQLADHIKDLESVVFARERALSRED